MKKEVKEKKWIKKARDSKRGRKKRFWGRRVQRWNRGKNEGIEKDKTEECEKEKKLKK